MGGVVPSNLVGRRKIGAPAVPADVQAAYVANIRTLVMTMAEWTDPASVRQFGKQAVSFFSVELFGSLHTRQQGFRCRA